MKRLAIFSLLALALSVGGCASLLKFTAETFDVQVIPEKVQQQAYKAASVGFTAWEGIQAATLKYGMLAPCGPGQTLICRDAVVWARLKEIEAQTSASLLSTKPLIEAGSDDVALLLSVPAAVYDAQAAFAKAKEH